MERSGIRCSIELVWLKWCRFTLGGAKSGGDTPVERNVLQWLEQIFPAVKMWMCEGARGGFLMMFLGTWHAFTCSPPCVGVCAWVCFSVCQLLAVSALFLAFPFELSYPVTFPKQIMRLRTESGTVCRNENNVTDMPNKYNSWQSNSYMITPDENTTWLTSVSAKCWWRNIWITSFLCPFVHQSNNQHLSPR